MKDIVLDAVRKYHERGDDAAYLEQCHSLLHVTDLVYTIAVEFAEEVELEPERVGPGKRVWARFGTCRRDLFVAEFDTEIRISKLASVFHVLHGFTVANQHLERVEPNLFGYGNTGYIKGQFQLHEAITQRLTERGYTELTLADMEEVIPSLSFLEGVTIFGPQVKVEHALFQDFRGLCPED
jgi:hypothetical protein